MADVHPVPVLISRIIPYRLPFSALRSILHNRQLFFRVNTVYQLHRVYGVSFILVMGWVGFWNPLVDPRSHLTNSSLPAMIVDYFLI